VPTPARLGSLRGLVPSPPANPQRRSPVLQAVLLLVIWSAAAMLALTLVEAQQVSGGLQLASSSPAVDPSAPHVVLSVESTLSVESAGAP